MEQTCCARNCSSNRNTTNAIGKRVEFYGVPAVTSLREEWVKRCQLSDDVDIKRVKICEIHFEKQYFNAKGRLVFNAVPSLFFPTRPPSEDREEEKGSSSESTGLIKKSSGDCGVKMNNQSNSLMLLKEAYVRVERLLNVSSLRVSEEEPESECHKVDNRDISKKKSKSAKLVDSSEISVAKPSERSQRQKVTPDSGIANPEPQNHHLRNGEIKTSKTKKSSQDVAKMNETKKASHTQIKEKPDGPVNRSDVVLRKRNDKKVLEVNEPIKKDGCDIALESQNEIKAHRDLHEIPAPSRTKRTRFAEKTVEKIPLADEQVSHAVEESPQKKKRRPDAKKKDSNVPKPENGEIRTSQRKLLTKLDTKLPSSDQVVPQVLEKEADEILQTRTRRQLKRNCPDNQEEKNVDPALEAKQPKLQTAVTEPKSDKAVAVRQTRRKVIEKLEETSTENSQSEEKITRQSKRKVTNNLQESHVEDESNITKKQPEKKLARKSDSTEIRKSNRVISKKTDRNSQEPESTDVPEVRPLRPKRKKAVANEEDNNDSKKPSAENPKTNNAQALRSLRVLRPKKKLSSVVQVSKSIMTEDCQEDLPQLTLSNNEHVLKEMNGLNPSVAEVAEDQEVDNHMKNLNSESPKKVTRKLLRSPRLRLGQKKEAEETVSSVESRASLESSVIFKNTKIPTLHLEIPEQHESENTADVSRKVKTSVEETPDKDLENGTPLSDGEVNDQNKESCVELPKAVLETLGDLDKAEPASEELEIEDGVTSNQEIEDISNIDHQADIITSEVNKELDEPDIENETELVKEAKVSHEPTLREGSVNSEEIEITDKTADNEQSVENGNSPQNDEILENDKSQSEEAVENELSQNEVTTDNEIVEIDGTQSDEVIELEKPDSDEVSENEKRQNGATDNESTENPPYSNEKGSNHDETPMFKNDQSVAVTEINETDKSVESESELQRKGETISDSPTNKSKVNEASSTINSSSKNNDDDEDLEIVCEKTTKPQKKHKYRLRIQIDKVINSLAVPEKVMISSKNQNSSPAITCLDITNDGDEVIEINDDKETDYSRREIISKKIQNNVRCFDIQDNILDDEREKLTMSVSKENARPLFECKICGKELDEMTQIQEHFKMHC